MDPNALETEILALEARITKIASIGGGLLAHTTQAKRSVAALRALAAPTEPAEPTDPPTTPEPPVDPPVTPEPPEPPALPKPLKGASAITGTMSAATGQRVLTRWGEGIALRLFAQEESGWAPVPNLPSAGRILASWKSPLGVPLDTAAATAALATAPAGTKVTDWHESDVKIIKGSHNAAHMLAAHAEFYTLVKATRPDLPVVGVLAGYRFHPDEDLADIDRYIDPATFDVLGVDLDGITNKYPDFTTFVPQIMAYLARIGKTRWTVPEFAAPRQPGDPTGSVRAAWLKEQVGFLRNLPNPPEEICLFESDRYANTELTTAVEREAWLAA